MNKSSWMRRDLMQRASRMLRSGAANSWDEARLADEIDAFLSQPVADDVKQLEVTVSRLANDNIDLTSDRQKLHKVATAAQALVRSVQPSLSPDTEIVSEPALTALESALEAAGYDSPEEESQSPPQEGHKPSCFVYRYARALIGADRRGMCDCGFEASQLPKP